MVLEHPEAVAVNRTITVCGTAAELSIDCEGKLPVPEAGIPETNAGSKMAVQL